MSDSKEEEEAAQNVPLAVEETQHLLQTEALAAPEPIGKTSNLVKDRKVEAEEPITENNAEEEAEGILNHVENKDVGGTPNHVENGKVEAEAPAEDKNVKLETNSEGITQKDDDNMESSPIQSVPVEENSQALQKSECEGVLDVTSKAEEVPQSDEGIKTDASVSQSGVGITETGAELKLEACEVADRRTSNGGDSIPLIHEEPPVSPTDSKGEIKNGLGIEKKDNEPLAIVTLTPEDNGNSISKNSCFLDAGHSYDGNESGTDEEQSAFMKELENFFRERCIEFKPPKFYGEGLNCLKLWRAVIRLGGYDKVTTCKLWRQVGESFRPPKTCTTVSWTFRNFYEKALLDYERYKIQSGEVNVPIDSHPDSLNVENQSLLPEKCVQVVASGRARRDAAARAMQGWHSQRLLGNGEVSDPIIKDRNSLSMQKREKQLKNFNLLKRKNPSYMDNTVKATRTKPSKPQLETSVIDVGPPADWVKINVQKTRDCFEIYALVPGLLREEVRVQSDPAGRLIISGEPEHPDNPWGATPFRKVVSLPSRIDPHQTSAVVTLHGQLFVRVPFEPSE